MTELLLSFTHHRTSVYGFSSIPFSSFLVSAVFHVPMKRVDIASAVILAWLVTCAVIAPVWSDAFAEGFSPFANEMPNYFLLSWFVLQKKWINVWLHLLSRMPLLFYSVLALLLICSFMVWTYSHWNQWRSSHFFIESSIVVSLTNMMNFTCLWQSRCQTSVLDL